MKKDEARRMLPYGKWTCADGREVLFNREYQPIWQRREFDVDRADPSEWVAWETQEWFYDDSCPPFSYGGGHRANMSTRKRCEKILESWGIAA